MRSSDSLYRAVIRFCLIVGARSTATMISHSPMTKVMIRNQPMFIKRDDLLHLPELRHSNDTHLVNGNKMRKFKYLIEGQESPRPSCLISYGGAQSNSMAALAAIARHKDTPFFYFSQSLPQTLKENPIGNLGLSLKLGMKVRRLLSHVYSISALLDNDINHALVL